MFLRAHYHNLYCQNRKFQCQLMSELVRYYQTHIRYCQIDVKYLLLTIFWDHLIFIWSYLTFSDIIWYLYVSINYLCTSNCMFLRAHYHNLYCQNRKFQCQLMSELVRYYQTHIRYCQIDVKYLLLTIFWDHLIFIWSYLTFSDIIWYFPGTNLKLHLKIWQISDKQSYCRNFFLYLLCFSFVNNVNSKSHHH